MSTVRDPWDNHVVGITCNPPALELRKYPLANQVPGFYNEKIGHLFHYVRYECHLSMSLGERDSINLGFANLLFCL